MTDSTLLVLSGAGIPPYSARGITETLEPIEGAVSLRRTVNGDLIDLSVPELRKYRLSHQCTDQDSPALSGIWPGMTLQIDCLTELAYEAVTGEGEERTPVPGSERTADGFVFYRPRLTVKVTSFSIERDEYGAAVGWTLDSEEA